MNTVQHACHTSFQWQCSGVDNFYRVVCCGREWEEGLSCKWISYQGYCCCMVVRLPSNSLHYRLVPNVLDIYNLKSPVTHFEMFRRSGTGEQVKAGNLVLVIPATNKLSH